MSPVVNAALLFCLLMLSGAALAQVQAEAPPQPITIEADHAEIDERKGESVYTGHVVLIQGKVRIEAERLTVYTKDRELERISAVGEPVNYRQQRDDEEEIRGHSQRLLYQVDTQILLLLDHAELWQGKNRFSGNRIQYDRRAERVTASQDQSGEQRVQVTIQPKAKTPPAPEPPQPAPAEVGP
jgi:lipopolysaccharide export system protein LptA